MMIFSTKITKAKLLTFALIFSCLALIIIVSIPSGDDVPAGAKVSYSGKTNEERVTFLEEFGWDIVDEPIEVSDVVIPTSFDSTYETYNELQKTQGMDLSDFKGMQATRYTYSVTNYVTDDGTAADVQANLLVVDDKIVAGDVTSVSLGGFMQGLARSTASQIVSGKDDDTDADADYIDENLQDDYVVPEK